MNLYSCYSDKIHISLVADEKMFSPFSRLIELFRERGATTPDTALSFKELGIPESFGRIKPILPPDISPIIKVGNKYYLSEERLAKFAGPDGLPSPVKKWIQHTAKVPKGFLRYRVLHRLKEQSMTGAELTSALERETEGRWRPKPGSIYPLLKSLLRDGLTRELADADGRNRRYELTNKGMQFLKDEIDRSGELREKIEQGFSPFPVPFSQFFERLDGISPPILGLIKTLQALPAILMSNPSPEVLEDLSKAAERFSVAIEKVRKKAKVQKYDKSPL
jgi:DNA-binding PadR family transcriptional regulator